MAGGETIWAKNRTQKRWKKDKVKRGRSSGWKDGEFVFTAVCPTF